MDSFIQLSPRSIRGPTIRFWILLHFKDVLYFQIRKRLSAYAFAGPMRRRIRHIEQKKKGDV